MYWCIFPQSNWINMRTNYQTVSLTGMKIQVTLEQRTFNMSTKVPSTGSDYENCYIMYRFQA